MLPFDDAEAKRAAKVRHALEEAGTVIGPFDVLIAAHALTRNFRAEQDEADGG